MKIKLFILFSLLAFNTFAQIENTGMTDRKDSLELGKIKLSGYVDVYYGFDFNKPTNSDRAYAISSPRHNEVNINLAYFDIKYQNERVRARFIPGVGTYINSNYAAESGSLKNIIEANVGLKLSTKKEIWIDAGVLGSPFTNETAISKDHLMYTRSFSSEYTPYYLAGVRLTYPLSEKITGYFYVINGWQQITDVNNPLSIATQIEYKINDNLLLNWDTYIGDEYSNVQPLYGMRYFSDMYVLYKPSDKINLSSCAYIGSQHKRDSISNIEKNAHWWQVNLIGQYSFNSRVSVASRYEYFQDVNATIITPITSSQKFTTSSLSACFNLKVTNNALFRIEGRHFFSQDKVYLNPQQQEINNSSLLITNITVWF